VALQVTDLDSARSQIWICIRIHIATLVRCALASSQRYSLSQCF